MATVQSDLTPAGDVPGFVRLRVKQVIKETADAQSIVFHVPPELGPEFGYVPGQFLTIRAVVDGDVHLRCYSLASAPAVDADPKVTVKRVSGGRVSNWLLDNVQAGDSLWVMPPKGIFRLRDGTAPVGLFAAGSGITPVMSILRQVLAGGRRRVRLVYANRDRRAIIFRQELAELQARHADRFTLIHRLDSEEGPLTQEAVGYYLGDAAADFYMCGPGPFMQGVRTGLRAAGVPDDRIFLESFTAEGDAAGETPAPVPEPGGALAAVTVRYHGQDRAIAVAAGETIHAAAARQGHNLPFSCKAGYCGLCLARVTAGTVRIKDNLGGISEAQMAQGLTLVCQALVESAEATVVFE